MTDFFLYDSHWLSSNSWPAAGVQIHSWGEDYEDATPNLEYVQPCSVYAVVNGQRQQLDLTSVPGLTPRQCREIAAVRGSFCGSGKP